MDRTTTHIHGNGIKDSDLQLPWRGIHDIHGGASFHGHVGRQRSCREQELSIKGHCVSLINFLFTSRLQLQALLFNFFHIHLIRTLTLHSSNDFTQKHKQESQCHLTKEDAAAPLVSPTKVQPRERSRTLARVRYSIHQDSRYAMI